MKKVFPLLLACGLAVGLGCEKKAPQTAPVDTSDPSKVSGTMVPPPSKSGKDATSLGGGKPGGPGMPGSK